ncbi:nitrate ABC transporter substrate-binding protein [Nostoc sp. C052]|uniref:nitrate ABC transporter substrate-binding protein n=1 Tax=Nostoc sp. C052 TaxID=2576902 RepID=UPI0015C2F166|nr:nitrate ABC transporter substrate-binding protein [Nostoc sp. C052]QLE39339.1 nitrate ABC transporter substrate-binding protein [Nostoc sp. C052]
MRFRRRDVLVSLGALTAGAIASCRDLSKSESGKASVTARPVSSSIGRVKLIVGQQDNALQETVAASGVLEGLPFDLQWAVIPGPAAQLAALYSKAIDVGLVGDSTLIVEQGNAKFEWTEETAPIQNVAYRKNPDPAYRATITAVRNSANIKTLADLRGKKWVSNFGGINYFMYVLSRIEAGLKVTDINYIQLVDGAAAGSAFKAGRADVFSGSVGTIKEALDSGEARILLHAEDLGMFAGGAFTARTDVIRDPDKSKALAEFFERVRKHYDWYGKNLDTVEKIYIEKRKQKPKLAKYFAAQSFAAFFPVNDDLLKRNQNLADRLFQAGEISKKIDVSVHNTRKFNSATVPSA